MDRKEQIKKSEGSENGSENGSNEDSDNEEKVSYLSYCLSMHISSHTICKCFWFCMCFHNLVLYNYNFQFNYFWAKKYFFIYPINSNKKYQILM